jgi:squalene-hopene/tetraprenyl-beta-curcumene cyclase
VSVVSRTGAVGGVGIGLVAALVVGVGRVPARAENVVAPPAGAAAVASSWNRKAAADYLDRRAAWWTTWPKAERDQGTFCVSCHTAVPYVVARSGVTSADVPSSPTERVILDNVVRRVRLWDRVLPYYRDGTDGAYKSTESRATEAVLNAFVLATHDARTGRITDDTRAALANMWALQDRAGRDPGAWPWQRFNLEPWEADDSNYHGAALAAVAVGLVPAADRAASDRTGMDLLRGYLQRHYGDQATLNRAVVLWAAARWPELLAPDAKSALVDEVFGKQQADGGWSLPSLVPAWKRRDGTPLETRSDGYATGLLAFALQQAGVKRDESRLARAVAWLVANQDPKEGSWPSYSLNKKRDPTSDTGRFMTDAATAYCVLALSQGP